MIELSKGKQPLQLANPVLAASGTVGFAGEYGKLIDLSKLGAIVTNPVTLKPRHAAVGTRVVPLDSGVLIHTGYPNPGINRVIRTYAPAWKTSACPVIVHLAATSPDDIGKCILALEGVEGVAAIEIGLSDDATVRDVRLIVSNALEHTDLAILLRIPLSNGGALAVAAQEAGAGAVVIAAPPRGTARDPISGQMIGGRVFGPWVKSLALRAVGHAASLVTIPIIGTGGIHNPDDAREMIAAGARAVQVDSITWVQPEMTEIIARSLGGLELTRAAGAFSDEWRPGIGETAALRAQLLASPPPTFPDLPSHLPR